VIAGLLSDTHGRLSATQAALDILTLAGATAFLHAGDIGGEHVLQAFVGRSAWFVWGNTDRPDPRLTRLCESWGLNTPQSGPLRVTLGGRHFVVCHGHEPAFGRLATALGAGQPPEELDVLVYGHTHDPRATRVGQRWLINPGALHRASPHTAATFDTASGEARFWRVDANRAPGTPPERFFP
jgi:hypothetical protein